MNNLYNFFNYKKVQNIISKFIISILIVILSASSCYGARDSNSYDGNIFPIYAGNGSIVPPSISLRESLSQNRVSLLFFYLDDSSDSKYMAPIISAIDLLWEDKLEILAYTIDDLIDVETEDKKEPSFYWNGLIPQTVLIDKEGQIIFDQNGQVNIDELNKYISLSTGFPEPDYNFTIESYNEFNSELSNEDYNRSR